MPMHHDFADWYRTVHIEPTADQLEKRWQAIEAFNEKATSLDLCDAARVFFGLTPKDSGFLARFREVFKAIDPTFPMRDNDAELQVLAGSALANCFVDNGTLATMVTLSLVCGAFEGNRKTPVPEIVNLARRTLLNQSRSLRNARKKVAIPSIELDGKFQKLKAVLDTAGAGLPELQAPLLDVLQPLRKLVIRLANCAEQAVLDEDLRQEESDILWWLFGERSRDLDVNFDELKTPSGCLVGAKEIADLTRVLPGPFGVEAYLHKMLGLAHPQLDASVSLSDAIFACPLEWQTGFVTSEGLDNVIDLCPVHLAIQKSVEVGAKKTAWHAPFQSASGVKVPVKLKPVDLAMQTYRERLFVNALSQIQESPDE